MKISTRHIGRLNGLNASKIIECKVEVLGTTLLEDVTDLNGMVDNNFISDLRDLADEFEEQNKRVIRNKTN